MVSAVVFGTRDQSDTWDTAVPTSPGANKHRLAMVSRSAAYGQRN
jgi:hypothetical protein